MQELLRTKDEENKQLNAKITELESSGLPSARDRTVSEDKDLLLNIMQEKPEKEESKTETAPKTSSSDKENQDNNTDVKSKAEEGSANNDLHK